MTKFFQALNEYFLFKRPYSLLLLSVYFHLCDSVIYLYYSLCILMRLLLTHSFL
jgi:hypothetical protein